MRKHCGAICYHVQTWNKCSSTHLAGFFQLHKGSSGFCESTRLSLLLLLLLLLLLSLLSCLALTRARFFGGTSSSMSHISSSTASNCRLFFAFTFEFDCDDDSLTTVLKSSISFKSYAFSSTLLLLLYYIIYIVTILQPQANYFESNCTRCNCTLF